jgi:hypothetical protein
MSSVCDRDERLIDFKPLKPTLVFIILFKLSVRTSKITPHFTITEINWLMLFKGEIAIYNEKHKKPINTNAELLIIKAGGTYF